MWLKVLARSDLAWVFDLLFSESQETLANSSHHIWEEKIIWKSQTLPKRKDTIKVGMKIENARLWTRFSLAEDGIKRGTSMKSVTRVRFQLKRGLLCLWFRASLICINNCQKRCNTKQSIYYSASSLYMFRVSTTPISYLPPTWPSLATLEGGSCTKNMSSTGGCSYSCVYFW